MFSRNMLVRGFSSLLYGCGLMLMVQSASADDIEIYGNNNDLKGNVLFVLDTSGSMSQTIGSDTRLDIMKTALDEVLADAPSNLNVGIMRYGYSGSSDKANGVSHPVVDIDAHALPPIAPYKHIDNLPNPVGNTPVREFLSEIGSSWNADGVTPIVDSLYEAALYFRGEDVDWGRLDPADERASHPTTYDGTLSTQTTTTQVWDTCDDSAGQCNSTKTNCRTETWGASTYCCSWSCSSYDEAGGCTNSTCSSMCNGSAGSRQVCDHLEDQTSSSLVGNATYKTPIEYECQASFIVLMSDGRPEYTGANGIGVTPPSKGKVQTMMSSAACANAPFGYTSGECGSELTHFLADEDQIDDSILAGDQTVGTFAVGFALGSDPEATNYLKSLVTVADGFFSAEDADQLSGAFSDILSQIGAVTSSFASPAYTVDQSTLLAHNDEVFIPVFDKSALPRWSGNLKKFKLVNREITGQNGLPAVNEVGEFTEDAQGYWSAVPHGKHVPSGGAAALLVADSRKLLTDATAGVMSPIDNNLDKSLFGVATDAERDKLVNFIRGKKDNGDERKRIGDMLHGKPANIHYTSTQNYIFIGTNEGYLHAFDANTGAEKFAFMPKSLLQNVDVLYRNDAADKHPYGVDGPITVWRYDDDEDGTIEAADGDFVRLYFGLRRGGNEYYALDVTDINNPTIMWSIKGGSGSFARLGQSWSKMTHAQMRVKQPPATSATLKDVLVFSGGYDINKDTNITDDSVGNDVFIVDAETGNLIWSLQGLGTEADDLVDSVPSDIRVLDMDKDNSIDRLYFADTGAISGVDLNMYAYDPTIATYDYSEARLTKLADLATGSDKRMFYHEVDVALMNDKGVSTLVLALGSGYRAHPLDDTVNDRFYVLLDKNVDKPADANHVAVTNSDLVNQSVLNSSDTLLSDATRKGWYMDLTENAEKSLAAPLIFMNKVIFTTFSVTTSVSVDPCIVPPNISRAYVLDLFSGDAVVDLDRDGSVTSNDKSKIIAVDEIADSPQLIFNAPKSSSGTGCTAGDCVSTVDIRVGKSSIPLVDITNAPNPNNTTSGSVNMSDILPRVFWIDQDVQ